MSKDLGRGVDPARREVGLSVKTPTAVNSRSVSGEDPGGAHHLSEGRGETTEVLTLGVAGSTPFIPVVDALGPRAGGGDLRPRHPCANRGSPVVCIDGNGDSGTRKEPWRPGPRPEGLVSALIAPTLLRGPPSTTIAGPVVTHLRSGLHPSQLQGVCFTAHLWSG